MVDIYGEGVKVAARLQERADPGGIVIFRSVYDQARSKLAIAFLFIVNRPLFEPSARPDVTLS